MFDDASFDTLAFSTEAFNFGAVVPDVAPVLLGRNPRRINRTRENDEALLVMLGML